MQSYLWRAVDQDGCERDILVTKKRDKRAGLKLFKKLFQGQVQPPRRIVTDKLRSYSAALRELSSNIPHETKQYGNDVAELSRQKNKTETT